MWFGQVYDGILRVVTCVVVRPLASYTVEAEACCVYNVDVCDSFRVTMKGEAPPDTTLASHTPSDGSEI